MKKAILILMAFTAFTLSVHAQNWEIGDSDSAIENKDANNTPDKVLWVYLPSTSPKCSYSSMLLAAFNNYFASGNAFNKTIEVQIIVQDTSYIAFTPFAGNLNIDFLTAENHDLVHKFALSPFDNLDADAKVYFFDHQKLVYKNENYSATGTELKPLEIAIAKNLGIYRMVEKMQHKTLKIGDKAPKVWTENGTPHDYSTANTIISFYPAPFSGAFEANRWDKNYPITGYEQGRKALLEVYGGAHNPNPLPNTNLRFNFQPLIQPLTCIAQPKLLADYAFKIDQSAIKYGVKTKVFAITNTTTPILDAWKLVQATPSVTFLNDADFKLAQAFNSFNYGAGYCKRTLFIIDKKGIIRFADTDFEYDDEAKIQAVLAELNLDK